MTTNKDVPIKFDDKGDQRRMMVMGADENFTKKTSELAEEVFNKIYGFDKDGNPCGVPFVDDYDLIAQFKHELFTREDIKAIQLRNFPHTEAYDKCFSIPRTTETTEIETILRDLIPFMRESLKQREVIMELEIDGTVHKLCDVVQSTGAIEYVQGFGNTPSRIALCKPLVFYDLMTGKPYPHATIERSLNDCTLWLKDEYDMKMVSGNMPSGFKKIQGRYRNAGAVMFALSTEIDDINRGYKQPASLSGTAAAPVAIKKEANREGERLRVNDKWKPDSTGAFETVNEMKPGVTTLDDKSNNVQYMDTFLLEADEVSKAIYAIEAERVRAQPKGVPLSSSILFRERLAAQVTEATKLFNNGAVCRVVYSGSKSVHMLVRVNEGATTIDEYKWLHAYLAAKMSNSLTFDPACKDPARLTRAPIRVERRSEYKGKEVIGVQELLMVNWTHIYNCNWRPLYEQWKNRPLKDYEQVKGYKLGPLRKEYDEAVRALLSGTFWTDDAWNGRRQKCFFPAYRLCRMLGFTHEELWGDDGILDGLNDYYRPSERTYWIMRESCDLVRKIDIDVEDNDE
jgi:hypothetical protein